MSDILDKLLGVERSAAEMVSAAETEAAAHKSRARGDGQKAHAELLKKKAEEAERAVAAARESAARERKEKNAAYRAKLAGLAVHKDDLSRVVMGFLSKGDA